MTEPQYEPTPVLDIVSFGYRKLFRSLGDLTKLSLPIILFAAITTGILYPDLLRLQVKMHHGGVLQPNDWGPAILIYFILFVVGLIMYYLFYALICYIKDIYYDEVQPELFSYLIPKGNFLGLLGIAMLYFMGFMVAGVGMVLGFILLILPGLAVIAGTIFLATRLALTWVAYTVEPENGVFSAFQKSWHLTHDNFWRSVGIWFVIILIQYIINLPFSIVSFIMGLISGLNPSMTSSVIFPVIYSLLFAASYWAQNVLGMGGMIFVWYRYYLDLKSRQAVQSEPVPPNPTWE